VALAAALAGAPAAAAAPSEAELLKQARELFQPLPKDMATPGVPITPARVALGRALFFDPRLTVDAALSCASCHQPGFYGADTLARPTGVKQRVHPRHAPSVLNAGIQFVIHWRGDRVDLEDQVVQALTSPITSGQPDEAAIVARVGAIPGYAPLFKAAFPDAAQPVSVRAIALAIGVYERTLVTPSPFDAWLAGKPGALTPAARAGLATFIDTGCATCHNGVGVGGASYQKFGVVEDYWTATGSAPVDKGRADVTKDPADLYVFRVASLRNVAMTPPYFHDGSVARLPDAVKIMARVQLGATLDDTKVRDIVAFLESLTGPLPASFAPPVLPPGALATAK
jgi:cytochrome c peroxidase